MLNIFEYLFDVLLLTACILTQWAAFTEKSCFISANPRGRAKTSRALTRARPRLIVCHVIHLVESHFKYQRATLRSTR